MTKKVRIENADNSDYEVEVTIWDKASSGPLNTKVQSTVLKYPTDLLETYITNTRYIVITEKKKQPVPQ